MEKPVSLIGAIFLAILLPYGQEGLQQHLNGCRPGDILLKQQMEYALPGASGKDITWNCKIYPNPAESGVALSFY